MADVDASKPKPVIERKHEWAHGTQDRGENCPRYKKPVFTDPITSPDECHGCNNNEWFSKGYVLREKGTKEVVHREARFVERNGETWKVEEVKGLTDRK